MAKYMGKQTAAVGKSIQSMSTITGHNKKVKKADFTRPGGTMDAQALDYKALFDLMPVPRFVVRPEGRGVFIFADVNARAAAWFARTAKSMLGRSVAEMSDAAFSQSLIQSLESCLRQKKTVMILAPAGFPGSVRIHHFLLSPVIGEDGAVALIDVLAQRDTSDASTAQRERDDALSLLSSIFDASEAGIVVTDGHRRVVKVNDSFSRTYGWSRDELIGADFTSVISPDERPLAIRNHMNFMKTGARSSGEVRIIRKNGTIANALFTSATLELSHRRKFQVTTVMDITLRKQMEISLRVAKESADAASRAKSTFLANMSHELRTPLNAIIGFSEIMMRETFGPVENPKYLEYLGDMHLSARHLLDIINEVLDMSKIEAGRVELDEHETDLVSLVSSVTRMSLSKAQSLGISLTESATADLPHLFADARLIRQILINLVTNAIKFTRSGGQVSVTTSLSDDGGLRFVVADTGIGIPKDRIKVAMEPFGQVFQPVLARGTQGTGLGLPLARAMTELHGGTLEIESEPGKGTAVTVSFPAFRSIVRPDRRPVASPVSEVVPSDSLSL